MKNSCAELEDVVPTTPPFKRSILIGSAVRFLFCTLSTAAALGTTGLASEPVPAALTSPATPKYSEENFLQGIDISSSAGEPTVRNFEVLRQQGYGCVIVNGWGGVTRSRYAETQLSRARSAGLLTAGYCYLNFASALDGGSQVREALTTFGSEAAYLGFLAIDVETEARNQLSSGLQAEPPDPAAQQEAVTRISEAVQEVERVGLRAVIYTKKSYWKRATGNTVVFSALPLWWTQVGPPSLSSPDLSSPMWTFGGWTNPIGKQYQLDTTLPPSAIPVDLNIFDPAAFALSNPNFKPLSSGPGEIRIAVNR